MGGLFRIISYRFHTDITVAGSSFSSSRGMGDVGDADGQFHVSFCFGVATLPAKILDLSQWRSQSCVMLRTGPPE